MKKVLALIVATLFLSACGNKGDQPVKSNWEKISDKEGVNVLIDTTSIKGKTEKKVWVKNIKPDGTSVLNLVSIQCNEDRLATLTTYSYNKTGDLIFGTEAENPKYQFIVPDTQGQLIKNVICSK